MLLSEYGPGSIILCGFSLFMLFSLVITVHSQILPSYPFFEGKTKTETKQH